MDTVASGRSQFLQHFLVHPVGPRTDIERDIEFPFFDLFAYLEDPFAIDIESVIINEEFLDAQFDTGFHFVDHRIRRMAPEPPAHRRSVAKEATVRTSPAGE